MSRSIKKVLLLFASFSLSILSCSYFDQVVEISRQEAIDSGLTQTALVSTSTPTATPLPTATVTPIPLDIILSFDPNPIDPVKSEDGGWIWYYTYSIYNPNSFPIMIAAFGDTTEGCMENMNSCSHSPAEFSKWFNKCEYSGAEISAGATACDTGYWYKDSQTPEGDSSLQNIVWYRDPGGNIFKVIGEQITLLKPSDPTATVNSATYLRQGPGTEYFTISSYGVGAILTITGKDFNCQWLQVLDSNNRTGWVFTSNLNFTLPCDEIPIVSYPTPPPTKIPATVTPACSLNGILNLQNDTGATVTLYLSGPTNFTFYLSTGASSLSICPGTYSYTAYGCGGATDTGTMSSGESHTFFCQ